MAQTKSAVLSKSDIRSAKAALKENIKAVVSAEKASVKRFKQLVKEHQKESAANEREIARLTKQLNSYA